LRKEVYITANDQYVVETLNTTMTDSWAGERQIVTRVDAVHIDGIDRTKADILKPIVRQLFESHNNFDEVVARAHTVRRHLEQLGAFKSVGVTIDTSSGKHATADGLEVTYSVIENRRVVGEVNTFIGNNNDSSVVLQLKCPNVFGRGLLTTGSTGFVIVFL
jgi:outer membrane protein insertion porin family